MEEDQVIPREPDYFNEDEFLNDISEYYKACKLRLVHSDSNSGLTSSQRYYADLCTLTFPECGEHNESGTDDECLSDHFDSDDSRFDNSVCSGEYLNLVKSKPLRSRGSFTDIVVR
ncbi:hypothetical protein GJ496_003118 [Pomphorhynchus laevis]|nr:hypothetical protein GJ496_003118 [Pomphorhynchus laevis]